MSVAVVINPYVNGSGFDVFEYDSKLDIFQKYFYGGDDRNTDLVFVQGKLIYQSPSSSPSSSISS